MSAPYEILAGPITVWLAAAGTAKVDVDETPGGSWFKLGASGSDNYDEDGLTVTHEQTIEKFRALGTTGNRKAWRTEEDLSFEFTVYDVTVEHYRKAINNAAITTTAAGAGTPGVKSIPMLQGHNVELFAMIARTEGQSPYADSMNAQYWVPYCHQEENPEVVFKKGEPAGLKFKLMALEDATNGFGIWEPQTAVAL